MASGVSMYNSVPLDSSQTIDIGEASGPHWSEVVSFSGRRVENQHEVAMDPLEIASVRNLFRIILRGKDEGGMKSQGSRTKSSKMRLEKCLSRVQVPAPVSRDSSYICRSIRKDEKEAVVSE
jgi:hypothetical protein